MDFLRFSVLSVILVFLQEVASNYTFQGFWPANLNQYFPYPTYSPVSFQTSQAKPYSCPIPMQLTLGINEKQIVQNNGYEVVATLNQPNTVARLTGGILGNNIFIYNHVRFHWNNDALSGASGLIDYKGLPIQAEVVFYNQIYGSFSNALPRRDGLAIILINIAVEGNIPNPGFTPFETILKQITAAGSSVPGVSAITLFSFVDLLALVQPITTYYAYPGSFISIGNQVAIPSATIIQVSQAISPTISNKQFEAFQNLRNVERSPINAVLQTYPLGDRPLFQCTGLYQTLLRGA